nr:hypothetical protein [Bacteroides ovatus]
MRNIYILWGLLACMAFTSCYEEDTLTPTEGGVELRFKVPQGNNSWDNDIAQIYEDYNVYLIYKDLQKEDFNRSWTGTTYGSGYEGQGCVNDEMTNYYVEFMKKQIFAYLNPPITSKVLPMYWYLGYNVHSKSVLEIGGVILASWIVPIHENRDGLDYWCTCMFGEDNPGDPYLIPTDRAMLDRRRKMILGPILEKAVKAGNIVIPEEFEAGFDHVTNLVRGLGMEDDPNYYLTRGYPGSVNTYVFNSISTPDNNSYPPTNEETFIGYMHLSMFYNQAQLAEEYPADKYPFLAEKFAFVQKYLKDKYQIDLEAIANGPENWDLLLPPIPETPDEE